MEGIDTMKSLKRLYDSIQRKKRIIKALEDKAKNIQGLKITNEIKGGVINKPVENTVCNVLELRGELHTMIRDFEEKRKLAIENIHKLDNELYKNILILRYIDFYKWGEIASILKYSEQHLRRLHNTALIELKKIKKDER